ncbi:MAG TPA: FmdE family protein [Methanotrichaceae archaeon]|nr:FmdE family protein [Methanotrichaceae archaeon]
MMEEDLKKAVEFHGHMCPGLAMGYRVAKYVKEHYPRSEDEELVAIVENKSCSIDAIQDMLGCTFGKGNLVFKDYGKQAFTFYSWDKGKALRIYFKGDIFKDTDRLRQKYFKGELGPEEKKEFEAMREQVIQKVLTAPDEELLSVKEVDIPTPEKARIYPSLNCQECGEAFMEIMGRMVGGKVVCQACFEKMTC